MRPLVLARALALAVIGCARGGGSAPVPRAERYEWRSVRMVGGGFVDGVVFHPTAPGVRFARTDIGGAYRWDVASGEWAPVLDFVPPTDANTLGVESVAVDPSDPRRVYLACGTYTSPIAPDAAVLRSSDGGRTWARADVPFKMGGNENGRADGERLAVDPNDGRILYLGTRRAGLWRSADHGATWARVEGFPEASEPAEVPNAQRGSGVAFVLFDPASGTAGEGSATIWAGISAAGRPSLVRSTDGGRSWQAVEGAPRTMRPTHGARASDGTMYFVYGSNPGPRPMRDGAIWKLTPDGRWTDVTPERPDSTRRFGYGAVGVDPRHPQWLLASSFYRPEGEELWRSTDGGSTWAATISRPENGARFDHRLAPYTAKTGLHWMLDVDIDPLDSDHAYFTIGYGLWETRNLTAADRGEAVVWTVGSVGIEETVALDLLSPPAGAPLISAIGDYGGFVHRDLAASPPEGNFGSPTFGNTSSLDVAWLAPDTIVRVGTPAGREANGSAIGWSANRGTSWRPAPMPTAKADQGTVAIGATGRTWIWTPRGDSVYVTHDHGARWSAAVLPRGTRVIADRARAGTFYAISLHEGRFFVSDDDGDSFSERPLRLAGGIPPRADRPNGRGDVRGNQDQLYATPGIAGDLWLPAWDGLHHSTDGGASFARLPGVTTIRAFGFGAAAPGARTPALYVAAVVGGVDGVFRSDDAARHWVRIDDDAHRWGMVIRLAGDPKRYGRVYAGTHGRGVFYGDPAR